MDLQAYLVNEKQYDASEIFKIKAYFGKVSQMGAYVLLKMNQEFTIHIRIEELDNGFRLDPVRRI
jgi:hypothetical protein